MAKLNFYDPDNPKQLLTRLRRLFNRTRMDEMEVSILRGLLSAVQRKIK
jgi:tRNA (cytidine32/uridine32-2'-O)-methyltransferase